MPITQIRGKTQIKQNTVDKDRLELDFLNGANWDITNGTKTATIVGVKKLTDASPDDAVVDKGYFLEKLGSIASGTMVNPIDKMFTYVGTSYGNWAANVAADDLNTSRAGETFFNLNDSTGYILDVNAATPQRLIITPYPTTQFVNRRVSGTKFFGSAIEMKIYKGVNGAPATTEVGNSTGVDPTDINDGTVLVDVSDNSIYTYKVITLNVNCEWVLSGSIEWGTDINELYGFIGKHKITAGNENVITTTDSLRENVDDLDTEIGKIVLPIEARQSSFQLDAVKSVYQNIQSLDKAIGNVNELGFFDATTKNTSVYNILNVLKNSLDAVSNVASWKTAVDSLTTSYGTDTAKATWVTGANTNDTYYATDTRKIYKKNDLGNAVVVIDLATQDRFLNGASSSAPNTYIVVSKKDAKLFKLNKTNTGVITVDESSVDDKAMFKVVYEEPETKSAIYVYNASFGTDNEKFIKVGDYDWQHASAIDLFGYAPVVGSSIVANYNVMQAIRELDLRTISGSAADSTYTQVISTPINNNTNIVFDSNVGRTISRSSIKVFINGIRLLADADDSGTGGNDYYFPTASPTFGTIRLRHDLTNNDVLIIDYKYT